MKRVAAGAHLLTPWLFEPAKRPDDRADYSLDCSLNLVLTEFSVSWTVKTETRVTQGNKIEIGCLGYIVVTLTDD